MLSEDQFFSSVSQPEAAFLQSLRNDHESGSVPQECLHDLAVSTDEDKEISREGIFVQDSAYNALQTVESVPHINGSSINENPSESLLRNHLLAPKS